MNELSLFSGCGGGILAGRLLGWRTVCAVEHVAYRQDVLLARQRDVLEPFPVWDDITTFDARPWRGRCDIVSGGFPCQDVSTIKKKPKGIKGEQSGLWEEMLRVVTEAEPPFVFIENSPMLRTRGLEQVLEGLASIGYDAEWCCLGGADAPIHAPHKRTRMWILAYRQGFGRTWGADHGTEDNRALHGGQERSEVGRQLEDDGGVSWEKLWAVEPGVGRVVDDVANRMDRIEAIGDGQIPIVAAVAFELLMRRARQ